MKTSWKQHYWYTVPCMKRRIERICELVGHGNDVVEVGCNEGFVSQALIESGNNVTSVDIDLK